MATIPYVANAKNRGIAYNELSQYIPESSGFYLTRAMVVLCRLQRRGHHHERQVVYDSLCRGELVSQQQQAHERTAVSRDDRCDR